MKRSMSWLCWTMTIVSVVCLTVALPAGANGQRGFADFAGQVGYLVPLKNALQTAGATALTSAQEASINTLVTNFRASHTPPAADSAVEAARSAYDNAIVAGQKSAALAQIPTIANEMAANAAARLQENAGFLISVVQVLDAGQVNSLVKQFGASRVVRLIEMLGGGPGGGRGPGPMGMGRPGNQ